jgi:hypothetical protein
MSEGRHPAFGSALPEDYSFLAKVGLLLFSPNFSGHVGQGLFGCPGKKERHEQTHSDPITVDFIIVLL